MFASSSFSFNVSALLCEGCRPVRLFRCVQNYIGKIDKKMVWYLSDEEREMVFMQFTIFKILYMVYV